MILALTIITAVVAFIFGIITEVNYGESEWHICLVAFSLFLAFMTFGIFNGFISYPPTEGTHQGVITAVDLEGLYFRRYEVYLKSSGYTVQSDETIYQIYEYETGLAEELKSYIGKEVKLTYGHDGGYIPWNSCGTYHIKSVELVEE